MTTTGDRGTPPTRVLLAIGTAYYTDPAYQESKDRASEPDSLSQSVPRSLLAVVEAFGRSRVDVKLPSPGYLLNPHPGDQLRQVLAEAASSGRDTAAERRNSNPLGRGKGRLDDDA